MHLTNVCYDADHRQMKLKFYRDKDIHFDAWDSVFFCKQGTIQEGKGYTVNNCDKIHFLSKEKVDKIVVTDDQCFKTFDQIPIDLLYLYDLSQEYQYLLHNNLEFSEDYSVGYLKIETEDDLDAEESKSSVLLISFMIDGNVYVFSKKDYSSETMMLDSFFKFIVDRFPDVVMGWNVSSFDRKYLLKRAKQFSIKVDYNKFGMIEFINMSDIILKKFGSAILKDTGGFSLDDVAKHFLVAGRKTLPTSFGQYYNTDNSAALEANLTDMIILEELNDKLQLFNFVKRIQKVSGGLLRHTFYNSIIVDSMILRRYPEFVFPSVKLTKTKHVDYEGGFVFQPPRGLFKNVAVVDFQSMYPSIILTFNISPDSKTPVFAEYEIGDVGFKSSPYGIFKDTITYLFNERLKLKTELKGLEESTLEYKNLESMQLAYKLILNSFYGVCAFRKFRLYDIDLAKSITQMGRILLNDMIKKIEEGNLGKVLYADTDSIFVQFNIESPHMALEAINSIFIPDFLSTYHIKDSSNFLFVDLVDLYDKMILFGKKKKYIAKKDDKITVKGFDTEKYDVPKCIRDLMKEIIISLFEKKHIDLKSYKERIKNFPNLSDYVILKRLNKKLEKYSITPQHLHALKWSIKYNFLSECAIKNRLMKFIYVKVDEKLGYDKTDVMVLDDSAKELPKGIELDFDKYFEFFLMKKMKDLYEIFGDDK